MVLGMKLHDGCMKLQESGGLAGVLAFKEMPYGFGLPPAVGAKAAVMVRHCMAGTFEQ